MKDVTGVLAVRVSCLAQKHKNMDVQYLHTYLF